MRRYPKAERLDVSGHMIGGIAFEPLGGILVDVLALFPLPENVVAETGIFAPSLMAAAAKAAELLMPKRGRFEFTPRGERGAIFTLAAPEGVTAKGLIMPQRK